MALQDFPNKMGIYMHADGGMTSSSSGSSKLDAAGESRAYIGRVFLAAGTGSKTISSSGGAIRWRSGTTVTFADAGSTIRVGIQDVASNGIEDGTFDVYADLVGGTDTIGSSSDMLTPMESGTKTISHGDIIAVVVEMISKGGSDSVQVSGLLSSVNIRSASMNFPYATSDSGSGPNRSSSGAFGCAIEFDDGTLGWIEPGLLFPGVFSSLTIDYNVNSTPDEYAAVFELPFKCRVSGGYFFIGGIGPSDTYEIILYETPTGTPSAIDTITMDPNLTGSATQVNPVTFTFNTPQVLEANTEYAVAVRPTATGSISLLYYNLSVGNEKYKWALPFGTTFEFMARSNQSGAFSSVETYYTLAFGLLIDQFDDGAGGGSGGFFIQ